MGTSTFILCLFLAGGGVGAAGACDEALKCWYGSDLEGLRTFAISNFCPGCEARECDGCVPRDASLNCTSHPLCGERLTDVLLSQHPAGCDTLFQEAWESAHRLCATSHGQCCPNCARPTPRRCSTAFTTNDSFLASVYTAAAALVSALALLADEATTVSTTRVGFRF